MKRILYTLALIAAVSCSDILERYPTTSVSEDTAYLTEEALESQITGCYKMFTDVKLYMGHMQEEIHTASFWCAPGKNLSDNGNISITNLTKYSNRTYMYTLYCYLYSAVNKCNFLIGHLPGSPVDASYKREIEAEARFLRGVLYFTLVRLYGDCPLWLESADDPSEVYKERTPYQKVYKAILSDFIFAEKYMRDADRAEEIGGVGNGRVNKWAATSYKAAVYMQIACLMEFKNYQFFDLSKEGREPDFSDEDEELDIPNYKAAWRACRDAAEDVIANGPYELAPNFKQLFRWTEPEDWLLKERIFCLQCNDHVSGPLIALWSLPPFPEGTLNTDSANSNWGKFRPSRFLFQTWAATYGGTLGTETNNSNIYVSCKDPRFNISMFHTGYTRLDSGNIQQVYPQNNRVLSHDATNYMPFFKKYLSPDFNASTGSADLYMMRFAEVYLMAAEARASLSAGFGDADWNKAMEWIEVLHKRARASVDEGESDSTYPKWASGRFSTKEELINAIMMEREFELCGEGHEYFDTHRRGAKYMLEQLCIPFNTHIQEYEQGDFFANGADQKGYWSTVYYGNLAPTTIEDCRKSVVCAFPEQEIRYNSSINDEDQNDFIWM